MALAIDATAGEVMRHLYHIYGDRNHLFFSGLDDRIGFLSIGVGDLQNVLRKDPGNTDLTVKRLARVVSRGFCIAEHFVSPYYRGIPLIEMVYAKYPQTHCAYCDTLPCSCPELRRAAHLIVVSEEPHFTLRES